MSTILGLDLSLTSTGYCVLEDGKIKEIGTIKPKTRGMERIECIDIGIDDICAENHVIDLVVIEGYSFGSKNTHAHSTGELGGIVKYNYWKGNYKTIIVPPTCLKKFVTGKGNAPKDVMMMKTLAKYGIEFNNNNECDAYCLAKMGQAYLEGTEIKYEQESLKKMEVLK